MSGSQDSMGHRIRVCHMIPQLRQGGAEFQLLLSLRAADKKHFEVHLCLMKDGDEALEREADREVSSLLRLGFRWRSCVGSAVRLRRYLQEQRIDILHCHLPLADSFGRIVGMASGVDSLFTTEHGKHLWKRWPHRVLDRWLNHRTVARICVSSDIARIRRSREGLSPQQSPVIPNAVDWERMQSPVRDREAILSDLGWPRNTEFVLAVGRLVVAKNYSLLIEAIELLHRKRPALRCLIAGGGPLHEELLDNLRQRGAERFLRLSGSRSDVPDLMHSADVYALSSVREGLPVAMLEAMACRLPVVATPAGGVTEVLEDGVNGRLVPHGDPARFAAAIDDLLQNPDQARVLGRRASELIATHYVIQRTVAQTEALYLDAMRMRKVSDSRSTTSAGEGEGRP